MGKRGQLAIIDIDFRKIERLRKAMKRCPDLIIEELGNAVRDLVLLVGVSVLRLRYGPLQVVHRGHGRIASVLMFGVLGWSALGLPMWGLLPLMAGAAGVSVYSATIYALDGAAQGRAMSGG